MSEKHLTVGDLKVGATYRGKRFREFFGHNNDRIILWISKQRDRIQYDSDTVRDGRNYPTVDVEKFLKWAKEEVETRMNEKETEKYIRDPENSNDGQDNEW